MSESIDKIILEINDFSILQSISLLAGKPDYLVKIFNKVDLKYYDLINYINITHIKIWREFT